MIKPSRLMSLLPPIKDPVEDEEQAKAHAIVMQRINAASAALSAPTIPILEKLSINNYIIF